MSRPDTIIIWDWFKGDLTDELATLDWHHGKEIDLTIPKVDLMGLLAFVATETDLDVMVTTRKNQRLQKEVMILALSHKGYGFGQLG